MERVDTLTARLLDNLIDGEEFLEELYLGVNFELEERRAPDGAGESIWLYRVLPETFRLAEILDRLGALSERGWVVSQPVAGFPKRCGPTALAFSLTEEGQDVYRKELSPTIEEYYK